MAILTDMNKKQAGSLIKPTDWNTLVTSVQGIGEALGQYIGQTDNRLDILEAVLSPLTDRLNGLEQEMHGLRTAIAPLLKQYVVTLSTQKVHYALGEICEISAEVRNLAGDRVTSRPWIDFLTTWGQLRAAPGFSTDVSANGSSISVRTNNEGIARVHIKSMHTENFTEAQDLQVANILETTLVGGTFFSQAIMEAPTPTSQGVTEAFTLMNSQYELAQSGPIQLFLDSYQQFPQFQTLPQLLPSVGSNWKHYRTVVVALVKDDSNPTTPDAGKGSASIQVQFRDWLGPWINGYINTFDVFVPGLIGAIGSQVGSGSFGMDLGLIQNVIEADISALGVIGRQRYYNAAIEAMDRISITTPPPYMSDLRQTVKQAVTVQQTQEAPALALKGNLLSRTPALAAISGMSRHAASAKDSADATLGTVGLLQASSTDLHKRILALDNDLQSSRQMSNVINNELTSIGQNVLKINTLDQKSVEGQINMITAQIGQINETLRRG